MRQNSQNMYVLQGLPWFRGNLKNNEKYLLNVTPYINVRIFLRHLCNHFEAIGITSEAQKMRILPGQFDAPIKDTIDLLNVS